MEPIITSFLDMDDYKFLMGQFIHYHYPRVPVEFALTNRSKIPLARYIDIVELKEQVDHMLGLRPSVRELSYLEQVWCGDKKMYSADDLIFLATNTERPDREIVRVGDDFRIRFFGPWEITTFPETKTLAIISELNTRALMKQQGITEAELFRIGEQKLLPKLDLIKDKPGLFVSDFCHRRRALKSWHSHLLDIMIDRIPNQLWGTSDTYFAMAKGIRSTATNAHELASAYAAMAGDDDKKLRQSPIKLLDDWWNFYGYELSIALTDTFGSRAYFQDMLSERLKRGKGFRQDSMEPIEFGELAIQTLKNFGIDPRDKMIVFSDGLTVEMILKIYYHFQGRIKMSFGWGTNLGNDVGFTPISMVIKLIMAMDRPAVKLSDNIAKAIGLKSEIERYMTVFDYSENRNEKCVY
ncbi:MAG: nicotinate phosphoribosyltransferase [Patescibacteria group bacterium]|nr:nicotinate phosphoribosyltransferase [Patescibacteria group bacterium]